MANETTSTTLAEAMGLGGGARRARPIRYNETLLDTIADIKNVPQGSGPTFDFIRYVAVSVPAGVKTEATGTAPNVAVETLQGRATSGVVGLVVDQSFESIFDARVDGMASGPAAEAARAVRKRAQTDACALATDLTAVSGNALTVPNMASLGLAMAAFEASCLPDGAPVGIVLHPAVYGLLVAQLAVDGASIMPASGSMLQGAFAGSISRGTILGANVFVTDSIAASTTGRSNMIIPLGEDKSPLGLAIWDPVQAVDLGPTDRYTNRSLVVARYGVVCADPSAGVEWITADD